MVFSAQLPRNMQATQRAIPTAFLEFWLETLAAVSELVDVPVIASGGAGKVQDFVELFKRLPKVDAGLAASIFHFGEVKIKDLKQTLKNNGIPVRI